MRILAIFTQYYLSRFRVMRAYENTHYIPLSGGCHGTVDIRSVSEQASGQETDPEGGCCRQKANFGSCQTNCC